MISCDQKFSAFDRFPCILECCFSFSLLSIVYVCVGGIGIWKQSDTKTSTLECKENSQVLKISDHNNVNKNRLTPLKLYSKKHEKNVMNSRDGSGEAIQSSVQEEPRPNTVLFEKCSMFKKFFLVEKNSIIIYLFCKFLRKFKKKKL